MLRCISYNCNSVRNNAEIVKDLLNSCDILLKSDLHFLDNLNEDFENVAFVDDRESKGIIEGRPARGVGIL